MPRKPPRALRRSESRRSRERPTRKHIRGLSAKAEGAIRRFEDRCLWPNAIADAVDVYAAFLRRPGRHLYVDEECPCCDPVEARDRLEEALRALPTAARAELRAIVERLDARFRDRTLPDPKSARLSLWHAQAWWRQRMTGP